MNLTRSNLSFILDNVDSFMDASLISTSKENKFILSYLNSVLGRYETNSLYNFKKLKQKDIKNLSMLDSKLIDVISKIYDYANFAFNFNGTFNKYVDNVHVSNKIYEVIHFLILEEKYSLNGVSFLEHLNIKEEVNKENVVELYNTFIERENKIRNNILLFWIRNKNLADKLENFYHMEVYRLV